MTAMLTAELARDLKFTATEATAFFLSRRDANRKSLADCAAKVVQIWYVLLSRCSRLDAEDASVHARDVSVCVCNGHACLFVCLALCIHSDVPRDSVACTNFLCRWRRRGKRHGGADCISASIVWEARKAYQRAKISVSQVRTVLVCIRMHLRA